MANTLSAVIPQLLAQGVDALRENALMPALVNRAYESMAGPEGSTIDVPVPSAIAATQVNPGPTPPTTPDIAPTSVPIVLDQWYESAFYMTDKDLLEVQAGTLPMVASEAIKSLANQVDQFLLDLVVQAYGSVRLSAGQASGNYPFESGGVADAVSLRTILNQQLAPLDPRYVVVDPVTEGHAMNVQAFHDASFGSGPSTLVDGDLRKYFGMNWFMDQNVRTHTAGDGSGFQVSADAATGVKTVSLDTGTGDILVGDIVTFDGDAQTYVVTEGTSGPGDISIEPGLQVALAAADNTPCNVDPSHVMNAGFHRDFIAFATRPLASSNHPGSIIDTQIDPISNLTLRLEVTREHRRDRYAFDILWGGAVIRRELGARLPSYL